METTSTKTNFRLLYVENMLPVYVEALECDHCCTVHEETWTIEANGQVWVFGEQCAALRLGFRPSSFEVRVARAQGNEKSRARLAKFFEMQSTKQNRQEIDLSSFFRG